MTDDAADAVEAADDPNVSDATTSRLEAFSDGVIAIAITLLIIEVKVPQDANGHLGRELARQWPSYAAFAISFVTIGIMWVNHHAIFERIARVNRPLMFLNLMLLMGISFLPFPTALLAAYVRTGGNDAEIAAAVYSTTMLVIGTAFLLLQIYLRDHRELATAAYSPARADAAVRRTVFGPIVYGATIALAFVSPLACLVVYAVIAGFFAATSSLPARRLRLRR